MNYLDWDEWLVDTDTWDRAQFLKEVFEYLDKAGESKIDRYAIGMLVNEIETYINCTHAIVSEGLVVTHRNGVAGRNHHLGIRDKALSRALKIMNELGLTPRHRKPAQKPLDPLVASLLRGPTYSAQEPSLTSEDST